MKRVAAVVLLLALCGCTRYEPMVVVGKGQPEIAGRGFWERQRGTCYLKPITGSDTSVTLGSYSYGATPYEKGDTLIVSSYISPGGRVYSVCYKQEAQ